MATSRQIQSIAAQMAKHAEGLDVADVLGVIGHLAIGTFRQMPDEDRARAALGWVRVLLEQIERIERQRHAN